MKVTEVRLKAMEDKGSLKAIGSITLDDAFVVNGVRVVEGPKGLFVSMPREKGKDEKYYDTAYPVGRDLREDIQRTVLDEYQKSRDIDRIIETVELRTDEKALSTPFSIGYEDQKIPEKQEKVSIKEKLRSAAERVSSQTLKKEEKEKEVFL